MELTVGKLKDMLAPYPNHCPVKFQHIILPNGKHYQLNFYRIDDRGVNEDRGIGEGSICHFEWSPITGL